MAWSRSYSTYTTASPQSVWKRHVTPEDWVADDPKTKAASFSVPPRVGDQGTVTSGSGTVKFVFTELDEPRSMTQVFKLPGAVLTLGHELEPDANGLRVTHSVALEGPLSLLFVPFVGWPLVRSRPEVVLGTVARALAEDEAAASEPAAEADR